MNKNELLERIGHVGLAVVTYYVVTSVILNGVAMLGSCTIVDTPYITMRIIRNAIRENVRLRYTIQYNVD